MRPPNKKRKPPSKGFPEPKEEKREPIVFDLNELLAKYGVSRNFSSHEAVGAAVQQLSSEIMIVQQVLLLEKMKLHAVGEYPYPTFDFSGYKIAAEIFIKAWGYERLVNIQSAITALEGQGYKIEAIRQIQQESLGD